MLTDSIKLIGSATLGLSLAILTLLTMVVISTSIIWQAFHFLCSRLEKYGLLIILLAIPIFALADLLVSWLTCLVFIGHQGSLDSTTPLGSPGLLLVHTPLRFAARLIGLYGLSAIVWTFVFILSQKKLRKSLPLFLTVVFIISIAGWGLFKPLNTAKPIKVTLVNETLDERLPAIKPDGAKLIVFPEYGLDDIENQSISKRILPTSDQTYFIGSRAEYATNSNAHLNQLVFGNTKTGITTTQDKHRLVPNGEDASYAMNILLRATGQKAVLDYFGINRQVIKGKQQLIPVKISDQLVLGSGICSSITSPEDYRSFARRGATVFTNSASLDIFSGSRVFAWQQKSLAQFMAVANARPFVQSANSAESFALDASGHVIVSSAKSGIVDATISPNTKHTLYTASGEWLAGMGALMCAYLVIANIFAQVRNRAHHTRSNKTNHRSKNNNE